MNDLEIEKELKEALHRLQMTVDYCAANGLQVRFKVDEAAPTVLVCQMARIYGGIVNASNPRVNAP